MERHQRKMKKMKMGKDNKKMIVSWSWMRLKNKRLRKKNMNLLNKKHVKLKNK